jgi:hypothetical protein
MLSDAVAKLRTFYAAEKHFERGFEQLRLSQVVL